jgi:integrase
VLLYSILRGFSFECVARLVWTVLDTFRQFYPKKRYVRNASALLSGMKIRNRTLPSGLLLWVVDFGIINGKRVQRSFPTKLAAEAALKAARNDGLALATVTPDEVRAALAFYRAHAEPVAHPPFGDLVEEYFWELSRLRRGSRYQAQTRAHLLQVGRLVGEHLGDWTSDKLKQWVCTPGLAPATQKSRLASVRAFLEWAKRQRYIRTSPLEGINKIRIASRKGKEIESFSTSDIRKLLQAILFNTYSAFSVKKGFHEAPYFELMGYVALAVFCGVRPEEIVRCELSRLDLEGRTLLITKAASKTASTRVIELPRVAVVWLRLWRWKCPLQKKFVPKNFQKKWTALRAEALQIKWVHDGLRHTFASMHYATHRNAPELKSLMGHSQAENTLFAHYRAVQTVGGEIVSKRMAAEFWALTPKRCRPTNLPR